MKKYITILIALLLFSCNTTKEVTIIPYKDWDLRGVNFTNTEYFYQGQKVFKISIDKETKDFAVIIIPKIKLNYTGGNYRISFIVKKGDIGNLMGLRIAGVPPKQTDIIFDLNNSGDFKSKKTEDLTKNEKIEITPLSDNWFRCSVETELDSSSISLIIGPTIGNRPIRIWESLLDNNRSIDLFFIPESLTIKEL